MAVLDLKIKDLKTALDPRRDDETEKEFQRRLERERIRKIDLLLDIHRIARDDPDAGPKLLAALAQEQYSGFRIKQQRGIKALPGDVVDDVILLAGVEWAKQEEGFRNVITTIRALKQHNGWKESVQTLRRRYYRLRDTNSKERRRVVELLARLRPDLEAHLKQIERRIPG